MSMSNEVSTNAISPSMSEFVNPEFIKEIRPKMLSFASMQLADEALAEDAVQEALVAALKNVDSFSGRSALKTWVFAILKNKIIDSLRKRNRSAETSVTTCGLDQLQLDERVSDASENMNNFLPDDQSSAWTEPMNTIRTEHFMRVFDTCLQGLSEKHARLIVMREFLEFDSAEICSSMDITASNLHVMLHRARLGLRECLECNWVDDKPELNL